MVSPRAQLRIWLTRERNTYADAKWDGNFDDRKRAEVRSDPHITDENWWMDFLPSYWQRARVLGLDTPQGRQALAKLIVTYCSLLECAIEEFGDLPAPGHSSGNIHPWTELEVLRGH